MKSHRVTMTRTVVEEAYVLAEESLEAALEAASREFPGVYDELSVRDDDVEDVYAWLTDREERPTVRPPVSKTLPVPPGQLEELLGEMEMAG